VLLVCAWVAVKEVSMLIGTLVGRLPLAKAEPPPEPAVLVSLSDVSLLFVLAVFARRKHVLIVILNRCMSLARLRWPRSARFYFASCFALATMGQSTVRPLAWEVCLSSHSSIWLLYVLTDILVSVICETVSKSSNSALYALPQRWMLELLDRIERDEIQIVTRRSSGLPFCFVAILRGELVREQRLLQLIPVAIERLVAVAKRGRGYPSIHALNVLRAIIHTVGAETHLGQFLAEVFVVCIGGYCKDFPFRCLLLRPRRHAFP
jgi:hypothetical protein